MSDKPKIFRNSKNAPLFLLCFAISSESPKAQELALRIQKANPDAKISVSVLFGDAISARLHYSGRKYNPFRIEPDEDEIDIMSLKIIKHRAIRASFSYRGKENIVHAVV